MRQTIRKALFLVTLSLCMALVGCAGNNPDDPYERFNRHTYALNSKIDNIIVRPLAATYNKVMPKPAAKSVNNFFYNLATIPSFFNNILQGNLHGTGNDLWRFIFNSTLGILGLFDVATHLGLERNNQDFGLTLAKWGYEDSAFLMLPFLGPSTVRDGIAKPFNHYMTIYPYIDDVALRNSLMGLDIVRKRANLLDSEDIAQKAALDQYVFIRNAFMQKRKHSVAKNNGKQIDIYIEDEKGYDDDLFIDEEDDETLMTTNPGHS